MQFSRFTSSRFTILHRVVGGSDGAGKVAKLWGADFHSVPEGAPFHLTQLVAQRVEEGVAGGGAATADDDDFGVDHVDDGSDAGGEVAHGAEPDVGRVFVARAVGGDEIARRGESTGGALLDRAVADGVFEAAGGFDDVGGALCVERDVPQMAGAADVAVEKLSIDEDRATDAGAQGEEHGVLGRYRGALPDFPEQGGVGIVEHGDGARGG